MSDSPTNPRGTAIRYAMVFAALFVGFGVYQPYFPVWLAAAGLDPAAIGIVLAAPMIVRIVAIPLIARLADRHGRLDLAFLLCAIGATSGMFLVAFTDTLPTIVLAVGLAAVFWGPLMTLLDAQALRGLKERGQAYGPVRLWGSVAFIATGFAGGMIIDRIPPENIIWLLVGALALTIIAGPLLPVPPAAPKPTKGAWRSALVHFARPAIAAPLVAAALVQASHMTLYGFGTLHWSAQGLSKTYIGLLWGIGVVAEVVVFALAARIAPRWGPETLIAIGAGAAVVRFTIMAFDPPALALPFIQVMHGLTFGATHLGTVAFMGRVAPPGMGASAQGIASVTIGAVSALATVASGPLYAALGAGAFSVMAVLAALALAAVLLRPR